MPCRSRTAPSSSSPWPTSFKDRLENSYRNVSGGVRRQGRRARGSPLRRLRRLQEGDGLPASPATWSSWPRRPRFAGSFRLRHPEGPQRLHGEADHGGRPQHAKDAQAGRGVGQEEPQGRRRPDVPALRGPPELFKRIKDGEIGDLMLLRGLSHAWAGRHLLLRSGAEAGQQRAAVPDPRFTRSCGPAAAATAISTSTTSTNAAG